MSGVEVVGLILYGIVMSSYTRISLGASAREVSGLSGTKARKFESIHSGLYRSAETEYIHKSQFRLLSCPLGYDIRANHQKNFDEHCRQFDFLLA